VHCIEHTHLATSSSGQYHSMISKILPLLVVLCAAAPSGVIAEIRTYKGGAVRAASYEIHYSEGYLVTPGYVDVSGLTFVANDSPSGAGGGAHDRDDDDFVADDDDEAVPAVIATTPPPTPAPTTKPTAVPVTAAPTAAPVTTAPTAAPTTAPTVPKAITAAPTVSPVTAAPTEPKAEAVPEPAPEPSPEGGGRRRKLDHSMTPGGSTVDVIAFHVPDECARSKAGCDWTELGVGASDGNGSLRWCCSDDAVSLGFCRADTQYGRLIIDKTKFQGDHRVLAIPASGHIERTITDGRMDFKTEDGRYVMIIANCNDFGRDLEVTGSYEFVSKHGHLPGELFGEMYFFAAITLVYFGLFIWYGSSMQLHSESRIPVQQWIILSIGLGLLECFFKTGDYFVWNEDGTRVWYAMYVGVVLGVIKRGISRSLIVMVSLGWGVIRDDLKQMCKIKFLGVLYVGVATTTEIMTIIAVEDMTVISDKKETELIDVITVLTFAVAAIDVTYLLWSLDALNSSMQYLENRNQNVKLQQYLRLRCFILLSMLFAVVWAIFGVVNATMDSPMLEDKQEWSINAAWHINYLFILIGIACLWRPTANAKEYAFVMELPSIAADGGEMVFDTNVDTIDDDDDLNDVSDHPSSENPLEDDEGFAIDKRID